MTVTAADYTGLITSQHNDKPKFVALVETVTGEPVDARNLLQAMPDAFDIDTAVGVQLDIVGQWVGLTRIVTVTPSEAYPLPAEPYQYSFDDDDYRRLLKARALANRWDGTPEMTVSILAAYYGPVGGAAAVIDNQDMSIDLILAGVRPTAAEAAVFSQMLLPVRPAGVRIADTFIGPTGGPIFGLDIDNAFIGGPDHGSFWETF
jgi:hypothetical protein